MTWTYSDPTASDLDAVRLLVGDTDPLDPLMTNEEITYLLSVYGGASAASHVAKAIAAKFARQMDRSIGSLSASFSQRYQHYLELSDELAAQSSSAPVAPFFSGWRRSQRLAGELDSDRDELVGKIGAMDNHEGSTGDY